MRGGLFYGPDFWQEGAGLEVVFRDLYALVQVGEVAGMVLGRRGRGWRSSSETCTPWCQVGEVAGMVLGRRGRGLRSSSETSTPWCQVVEVAGMVLGRRGRGGRSPSATCTPWCRWVRWFVLRA